MSCLGAGAGTRWSPVPGSRVTRHVFVSFVTSITPDTGRSQQHTTSVSYMYLVQYLSSQDESVQDPERARMENLNYLLSKVFDGWRMATNKVLITEPSPSPAVSPAWNNGEEVPRWGVAEIQKISPSTTGRCYCCH